MFCVVSGKGVHDIEKDDDNICEMRHRLTDCLSNGCCAAGSRPKAYSTKLRAATNCPATWGSLADEGVRPTKSSRRTKSVTISSTKNGQLQDRLKSVTQDGCMA